jgi:hypothetical protein
VFAALDNTFLDAVHMGSGQLLAKNFYLRNSQNFGRKLDIFSKLAWFKASERFLLYVYEFLEKDQILVNYWFQRWNRSGFLMTGTGTGLSRSDRTGN